MASRYHYEGMNLQRTGARLVYLEVSVHSLLALSLLDIASQQTVMLSPMEE